MSQVLGSGDFQAVPFIFPTIHNSKGCTENTKSGEKEVSKDTLYAVTDNRELKHAHF